MTKKQIEEALLTEMMKCHEYEKNDEGELDYKHPPMSQGTYLDGIHFAIKLLQGRQ